MALSFHVMFYYHDALLFRVPTWGLVFFKRISVSGVEAGTKEGRREGRKEETKEGRKEERKEGRTGRVGRVQFPFSGFPKSVQPFVFQIWVFSF